MARGSALAIRRSRHPAPTAAADALPVYGERFVEMAPSARSLHTPTLSELAGGDLLAVWKAREPGRGRSRSSPRGTTGARVPGGRNDR